MYVGLIPRIISRHLPHLFQLGGEHLSEGMAPSNIVSDELVPSTRVRVKASGQIEPEYALLGPYEEFPKRIEGPTVWEADDYRDHPERWTHAWSDEEVEEIEAATDKFLDAGYELTDITKVRFLKYQRCPLSGLGGLAIN